MQAPMFHVSRERLIFEVNNKSCADQKFTIVSHQTGTKI